LGEHSKGLAHGSHKANAPAREGPDEPLLLAVVIQCRARGIDPGAQGGIGHGASAPYRRDQLVLADDMPSSQDQVEQEIEDLRFESDRRRSAKQLTAIRVEHIVFEKIPHSAIRAKEPWRRRDE